MTDDLVKRLRAYPMSVCFPDHISPSIVLTAGLVNDAATRIEQLQAKLAAERSKVSKLRSLAARARVFVNEEFLRRGADDDENYDDDEQAIPLLNAIDDILKETGDGDD